MKNHLLLVFFLIAFFFQNSAFGQAGNWPGSTNRGTVTPGDNVYNYSALSVGPGDYVLYNACQGVEYYFYACNDGNWDVDYVIFTNAGGFLYDFDGSSACSWRADGDAVANNRYTASSSTTLRVIMPQYNRSTANSTNSWNWTSGLSCTRLGIKEIPQSAPGTPTGATTICSGGTATLTRSGTPVAGVTWYWQTSSTGTSTSSSGSTFTTPALVSTTTYYVRPRSCNGYWGTASAGVTVNVDEDVNASAGPDDYICLSSTATMAANNPAVGTGVWSWSGPGTVSYVTGTSSDYNAEVSFSASGDYTGTWTVTNGACSANDTVVMFVNNPNPLAMSDVVGTCLSDGLNGWVHIYDPTGQNIIASVNDNGQNIGDVTAQLYYHGGAAFTVPASGSCNQNQGVLNRSFVINTTIAPSSAVGVRLYFTDAELLDLISVAGCGDPNGCADNDDVCAIGDLFVTQISGAASEDGTFTSGDGTPTLHTPTNGGTGNASFGGNYVEFSVTQFSEFWIHGSESGVPLPVELISFKADAIDNQFIQLTWLTATEINNDGFELMRSENGIDFERIAWIPGHGNSTETNAYVYKDTEVNKGVTYYYQLKQVDFDGQYELFDIVSARLDGVRTLYSIGNLVPNPSKENARVKTEIVLNQNETLNVTVYNHVGMKVQSETYNLNEGTNSIEFNIQGLSSGTYFVNFEGSFGRETRKLVITK